MQYEYYAFRLTILDKHLVAVTQAAEGVGVTRNNGDRNARKQAENKMKHAAEDVVRVEPHLGYLLCEVHKKEAEQGNSSHEKKATFSMAENAIQDAWKGRIAVAEQIEDEHHRDFLKIPCGFKFTPASESIGSLPSLSFLFTIPFRLQKPYVSKDERDFYLLDNPLRREKVFKTPMVAATSWKGALRSAMLREMVFWWRGQEESQRKAEEFAERRFRLTLLFGDEKGEEPVSLKGLAKYLDGVGGEEAAKVFRSIVREYFGIEKDKPIPHFRGRLHFFPTFFDNVGLEVINPHDRKTGVGARGPILMECVPAGTQGTFTLLYVPFGPCVGDEGKVRQETVDALQAVAEGVQAMLTKYGFGAKTSGGFGTVKEKLPEKGVLAVNTDLGLAAPTEEEPLPNYLESRTQLKPEYLREDGSMKSWEEYEGWMKDQGQTVGRRSKKRYNEAKKSYEEELPKVLREAEADITKVQFDSFSKLVERAGEIAERLRRGENDE